MKQRTAALAEQKNNDPDLQRAKDVVDLHYGVKVRYEERGLDEELVEARRKVEDVIRGLER